MAYFDNAATTYPKPECVYKQMDEFYRNNGANAGRGQYELSKNAGLLIRETRELIQETLNCPTKQVVFVPTATIALNMIIQGLLKLNIKNIYITPFEHNAVTRVLNHYKEDINIHELKVNDNYMYDLERIRYQFETVTPDLVIMSHASNTIGLVSPVEAVFKMAKKYDAFTVVDMAQTAGLVECNVGLDCFDFAVFAGHKTLYGPTGISGFVMKPEFDLPSVLFGGTGYDSANQDMPDSIPEKFEMGTLNISGIAGLNAALKWLQEVGINSISEKEKINREKLITLLEEYDFIEIVGLNREADYVGVVSCRIDGISSESAGRIFEEKNISVRTGLHCAPLAHKFLNTYPAGTIRFSVNYFNDEKDFQELEEALDYIDDNL